MNFDEWAAEARRSLDAWSPEPAVHPVAPLARIGDGGSIGAGPDDASGYADLVPAGERQQRPKRRRLLAAAAAIVLVAAAATALALPRGGEQVTVTPQSDPAQPTTAPTTPTSTPAEAAEPDGPWFDCSATDANGELAPAPTDAFDADAAVATWEAFDIAGPGGPTPTTGPATYVKGTVSQVAGEDLVATRARGVALIARMAPPWGCTVWSPEVDVSDPAQAEPNVDQDGAVTNRMGGMCFVPDASSDPRSVWGLDPDLAAELDTIDGLTSWTTVLADGGGNGQGPGRLWLEFTFEADPDVADDPARERTLDALAVAAVTAGESAGVTGECTAH